ncbi:MAG: hypothetical protein H7318_09655 [Oligoflexus sp.]|nr:hypothetical protein [Oligoflexus sp.]
MFGIVYGHNKNGKLERVYYFENVTVVGKRISPADKQSKVISAKIHQWKGLNQLDLRPYWDECMYFAWYDNVYWGESVLELIEFAEKEPLLVDLCDLLYQRV